MLAVVIYVVKMVRRALRKLVRTALILADSFKEAQEMRRALPHRYIEG
jgi:hypothetical protein